MGAVTVTKQLSCPRALPTVVLGLYRLQVCTSCVDNAFLCSPLTSCNVIRWEEGT